MLRKLISGAGPSAGGLNPQDTRGPARGTTAPLRPAPAGAHAAGLEAGWALLFHSLTFSKVQTQTQTHGHSRRAHGHRHSRNPRPGQTDGFVSNVVFDPEVKVNPILFLVFFLQVIKKTNKQAALFAMITGTLFKMILIFVCSDVAL